MKARAGTFLLAIWLWSFPALAGDWTLQNQQIGNDTAIISVAAASEEKAVGFGIEPDDTCPSGTAPLWFRTQDGQNWSKEKQPGVELTILSHLSCPSETRCWAVGMSVDVNTMAMKKLFKGSVNGGDSWFDAPPPTHDVAWISAIDATNLWLMGGSVIIPIVESKAQTAFVPKVEGDGFTNILDASFVDGNTVFLVNGASEKDDDGNDIGILPNGALLRSDDGGTTWTSLFRDRPEKPTRVRFITDKIGFLMGETPSGPFVRRTDDGGQTWMELLLPTPASVPFPDSLDDWAIFNSKAGLILGWSKDGNDQTYHVVYRMKDGHTLQEEPLPDNQWSLFTMTCPSQKTCWIAGENHVIWKFEGSDADVITEGPIPIGDTGPGGDVPASDMYGTPDSLTGSDLVIGDGQATGDASGGGSSCTAGGRASGGLFLFLLVVAVLTTVGRQTSLDG